MTADILVLEKSKGQLQTKFLLLGAFILSGLAGLIYQSVWSQYLGLFLGHAAYAQALVLAIFMGGMAIGAMLVARLGIHWNNLIRGYAIIEAIIGVFGIAFHFIFIEAVDFSYDRLIPLAGTPWLADLSRWLIAAILIIPQTILLGMTFPLMSGGLIRRFPKEDGQLLGGLYFTNSIGAAFGALMAAFFFLPQMGLPGSMVIAGVLNLLVAAIALWLSQKPEQEKSLSKDSSLQAIDEDKSSSLIKVVLFSTALSGAASFVYEIVWIRMLSMAVGSTLHAFELMLASFIAGIAFGGLWIRKRADVSVNPLRLAGWMQVGMGLAALFSLTLYGNAFGWVSWIMQGLARTENGYAFYTMWTAGIAILIMLPAAFFAGTTLPLFTVTLLRAKHGERAIGQVYAWNTIGSIAGVFIAMHYLIPSMGLKLALIVAAFVDMLIGLFILNYKSEKKYHNKWNLSAGFLVIVATALSIAKVDFDPMKLASGVFRTGNLENMNQSKIIYYKDGKTASISVREWEHGVVSIATNGKTDAAIAMHPERVPSDDESTMALAAAIPLAMHEAPKEIGVIGFGSGMTTHTFLGDARVERVDTIEIESAMVNGARIFGHRVARAFQDHRSNIIIDDAKAYFSGQQAKYDIIISEPSNPWISGVGSLFSKEFYDFLPRHLKSDGIFVQWVQLYEIDDNLVSSIMNALTPNFSDYKAYLANDADLLIVAKPNGKLPSISGDNILNGLIGEDLARLGIKTIEQLEFRQIADARVLRAHGEMFGKPANSYYHPYLSLEAPKTRFMSSRAELLMHNITRGSTLFLDALNIREPLSSNSNFGVFTHYSAEKDSEFSRYYAQFLSNGEITEKTGNQIHFDSIVFLKTAAHHACENRDSKPAKQALINGLRNAVDIMMPFLPQEVQKEIFVDMNWLGCKPVDISDDFHLVSQMIGAMAMRDWSKAHDLGMAWLHRTIDEKEWKNAIDDIALSAVLLSLAHFEKWEDLQTAESALGKDIDSSADYFAIRSLLLAMADVEIRRARVMSEATHAFK